MIKIKLLEVNYMIILGIETSCDETAAAILEVKNKTIRLLGNVVDSQISLHEKFGGVVPEVAAREHMNNMLPILRLVFQEASLDLSAVDLVSSTQGPGLATSLMVGLETGKSLAWSADKKFVPANHLLGHVFSWLLPGEINEKVDISKTEFPFLTLLVSGGHTELVLVSGYNDFKLLGRTLDDAAGEAFDKVAKMLELGYPGGPEISRAALKGRRNAFLFPRPLIKSDDFNFSFAGLKTAVLYELKKIENITEKIRNDIAASFEAAVAEVLVSKTLKAAQKYNTKNIVVAGGVSANKYLREEFGKVKDINVKFPYLKYTGDNAAMIALAGYIKFKVSNFKSQDDYLSLKALPNLTIV